MSKLTKGIIASLSLVCTLSFSEDLKIGTAGPLTGTDAELGTATYRAAKLYFDEVNKSGGVLGKQIVLVEKDDECNATKGGTVAKEFVDEKVSFIIGHNCSGATLAALPAYKEASILAISPSATNPTITQSGNFPNFFRTIASDDLQGKIQVDFSVRHSYKKVALVHDETAYGSGLAEFVEKFAKTAKIAIALKEEIKKDQDDYPDTIKNIIDAAPEALIFSGNFLEAAKIIAGIRKTGSNIPLIIGDGAKSADFIKVAGEAAEGTIATGPRDTSESDEAKSAIAKYKEAHNNEEPGSFFLEAYAASEALINAVKKAGAIDSTKVAEKLRSEKLKTTIGDVQFDTKGDTIGAGFSLFKVKDGKWMELKTR